MHSHSLLITIQMCNFVAFLPNIIVCCVVRERNESPHQFIRVLYLVLLVDEAMVCLLAIMISVIDAGD